MIAAFWDVLRCREPIGTPASRNIVLPCRQAYQGLLAPALEPLILTTVIVLVRNFIGIESGLMPYPVLAVAGVALWIFLQESISEGLGSILGNAALVRKFYFATGIFPLRRR